MIKYGREISRRRVLQVLGVGSAGVAVAAGCSNAEPSGGSKSSGAPGGAGGGGTGSDAVFRADYPYDPPPAGNFNLLTGVSGAITIGYLRDLIQLPGAMYYWDSRKFYYLLADESTTIARDGKTLTYKVRDGLSWSDGKPITAQDVYSTWLLQYILGNSAFTYVDSFEKTDDMTVTFHFKTPAPLAQYQVLRTNISSDADYGALAKEAEPLVRAGKPVTDKDVVKLSKKVSSLRPKGVIASGPFNFDTSSVTQAQLTLVKNDKGYRADKVQWGSILVYNGTAITLAPVFLEKKIYYATNGFPVATDEQFQKIGIRVLRDPTYFGAALYFNYAKHPEFMDKRVRQALAHATDRSQIGQVAEGKSGKGVNFMAGMSDVLVPQWLSSADQAKLNNYEHDEDKAAKMLTAAGWTKSGGRWMLPNGKPATYELLYVSTYADWSAASENLASQLNAFGFKITVHGEADTLEPVDIGKGKFSLGVQSWGNSSDPIPSGAYETALLTYNYPDQKPNRGMDFPLQQKTDVVGETDFETAIPDSNVGADVDALKPKLTKLALAFNELLPVVPMYERSANSPVVTEKVTGFPPDGDPIYKNSIYADNFVTFLMYDGTLRPA